MGKKTGTQLRGSKFLQAQDSLQNDFDNERILTLAEKRLNEEIINKITAVLGDDSAYKEILPQNDVENSMVEQDKELDPEIDDREDLIDPAGEIEDVLLSNSRIGNNQLNQLYLALRGRENNIVKATAQTAMPLAVKGNMVDASQIKLGQHPEALFALSVGRF